MDKRALKIYAITDRQWLKSDQTLGQAVEQAILGGATIIQLREKYLTGQALKDLALQVKQVCNSYRVPFIINDDAILARDIDADGVHVGQSDMTVADARKVLGKDKIVGATAKTIEQAKRAQQEGADYLGSGAIFGTSTKLDAKPMTMELLNSICDSVSIPVVAIGGIDKTNISRLKAARVAGAAVVSGIFASDNILRATQQLNEELYGRRIIHCITNSVTVNQVANVILATGGSPIMAHHKLEVASVQDFASGLLVNLGATDDYQAIEIAYKEAINRGTPIVIDPVGVGGIPFRREFMKKLINIGSPTCIRGNYGEIKAIYKESSTMEGLDCQLQSDESVVQALAKKLSCIVVASGQSDIIADADNCLTLETGHQIQKSVTGSGCMLSAVICQFLANGIKPSIARVVYACKLMGDTAREAVRKETAGKEAAGKEIGMMSFLNSWLDLISIR